MSTAQDAKTARKATGKPKGSSRPRRVRRAPPGDLTALRRELWHALRRAGDVLDTATEPADVLRAAHAVAGCANAYTRLTEATDHADRLAALEAAEAARTAAEGRRDRYP